MNTFSSSFSGPLLHGEEQTAILLRNQAHDVEWVLWEVDRGRRTDKDEFVDPCFLRVLHSRRC
jgi:hypothetical protein